MALSLVGNTGRGQIWVGLSSVMSKEAPIPPAPSCEAAQPNHGHPTLDLEPTQGPPDWSQRKTSKTLFKQ